MRYKAGISYLQIALLLLSMFAICYLIGDSVEMVDAAEPVEVCCEETNTGNTCQNAVSEECNPDFKVNPSSCEVTEFCESGCCVSPDNGQCSKRTSKRDCEKVGGEFHPAPLCQFKECEKGCCVLGSETEWTTEKNCEFEADSIGLPLIWDGNVQSEIQCLFSAERDKEGACTYESGDETKCIYTTSEDCNIRHSINSESNPFFYKNSFCSNPELNTVCKKKDHKGCVDGEEDVYWFDSCGNKEDVAKDCNLYKGTYCRKKGESASCESVNCEKIGRKNGESWCSYDGIIDSGGRDPVGSRHVKHICYMGTERLDPCADFRNEICVQEDSSIKGKSFSSASCRVNQWRTCMDINREGSAEKITAKCEKNPDCYLKTINMHESFKFTVCLPNYPPGFELTQNILNDDGSLNEEAYYSSSPADGICSTATKRCTSTWLVGLFCPGCIDNCDCHTKRFTTEMNDFCVSLGDCGGYINYVGEYTEPGYSVKSGGGGDPGRLGNPGFSNVYGGKPADPGSFEFYENLNPELLRRTYSEERGSGPSAFERELLGVSGAYGSQLLLKMLAEEEDDEDKWVSGIAGAGLNSVNFARYTGGFSSSVSSAIAEQMETFDAGEQQDFSMIAAMIAGLIAYVITQSIMFTMIASLLAFLFFMPCIVVTHNVDFTCSAWEPPAHGDRCNECNTLDVPCSEYRCESLGELCQFINKGTDNELCISRPENKEYPKIEPLRSVISEGYEYHKVSGDGFEVVNSDDKKCIDAYTTVRFGIKVDPFARCRLGVDPAQKYDEMADLFGPKGNVLLPVHRMDLFFPSPDAFRNQYNLTEEAIEKLGKIDYYVKCKTASGRINPGTYNIKSCVKPGPDLTAPVINPLTFPKNNGYIKYGKNKQKLKIYVNEPSECKWSSEDKNYKDMENEMECETDLVKYTVFGLPCTTTLTKVQEDAGFFIKCKDQPWFAGTVNESKRNTMSESFDYELSLSKEPLVIDEFRPADWTKITEGFEPLSVTLKATTSGGADGGTSVCSYKFAENGYYMRFFETNASVHKQEFSSIMSGDYNIEFRCEDVAGNVANASTSFEIDVDSSGPRIVRVYYDAGLKVITHEKAKCKYSFDRKLSFENATAMYGDGFEHFGDWQLKTYYIQCEDDYGNKGSKMKVKGYKLV